MTLAQHPAELRADHRQDVAWIWQMLLDSLPSGYEEVKQYRMIGYVVRLECYLDTYNGLPFGYAVPAAQ